MGMKNPIARYLTIWRVNDAETSIILLLTFLLLEGLSPNEIRKNIMQRSRLAAIIAITGISLSTAVWAHSGATGIVKERMDLMGEIAKATKVIGQMVSSKTLLNSELANSAAKTLRDHAEKMITLFPAGSLNGPSEAKPEIWEDWETFSKIAADMQTAAGNILADTSSINAIKPNFVALAKTCSGCHEKFRLKK